MMNAVMPPRVPFVRSLAANVTITSAKSPLVIQILLPSRTQSSPSCTAVVDIAPASLPESASVSA